MVKAIWNNQIVAESDETIVFEGNHYFPPSTIKTEFFENSEMHTICPYKGEASYYNLMVDGQKNKDAAWYYPTTKMGYEKIAGYVAFWRGVKVE
jgi:uncharacterized protein (DUF427 family)